MNKITNAAKKLGEEGDERARKMLNAFGFVLSRPDWSGYRGGPPRMFYGEVIEPGEDVEFEVKAKTRKYPGPEGEGHGADIKQIKKRMRRYRKHGIRQFLLIIEANGDAYGQWLHKLEDGPQHDTDSGIRVYPTSCFHAMPNSFWEGWE